MMKFKDHFSKQASGYSQFRPEYPHELFEFLTSKVSRWDIAWDCGTGSGQAARYLADYFKQVIATDRSLNQLIHAEHKSNLQYIIAACEQSCLRLHSVDLITVAQAIHWFDFDLFYEEVKRVLHPDGIIAVWCYELPQVDPQIDQIINYFYTNILQGYWAPERKYIDERYQTIPFPFTEIQVRGLSINYRWDAAQFLGFLNTWSAVQKYKNVNKTNPIDQIRKDVETLWQSQKTVSWKICLRAGKNQKKHLAFNEK